MIDMTMKLFPCIFLLCACSATAVVHDIGGDAASSDGAAYEPDTASSDSADTDAGSIDHDGGGVAAAAGTGQKADGGSSGASGKAGGAGAGHGGSDDTDAATAPESGTSDVVAPGLDGGSDAESDAYDPLWDPVAVGCPQPYSVYECAPERCNDAKTPTNKTAVGCCRNFCQCGGDWGDGNGCERLVKCADDPTYPNCIQGPASCGTGQCPGWNRYPDPETCLTDKPGYPDGYCAHCEVVPGTCSGGTSQILASCPEGASPGPGCTPWASHPGQWCCP